MSQVLLVPEPDQTEEDMNTRKAWETPRLERQETLPRVTNGFGGSFTP